MRTSRGLVAAVIGSLAALCFPAGAAASSGSLQITGAGFGHGIGMSQYGALGFAQHGYTYQQIISHYYSSTTLGQHANTPITVLLHDGAATFQGASRVNGKAVSASRKYGVVPRGSRLELISGGRNMGTFAPPLSVSGAKLTLAGLGSYAGSILFSPDGSGGVLTVNSVDLEDYVKGVVPRESPSSWPAAALEAQAVAARSYALADPPVNPQYDVYADTRSQVYGGLAAETTSSNAAVTATAGQVVMSAGNPAITYFFSSSGGETESVQNVFTGSQAETWLVGVPDPYDNAGANPYYRWSKKLTLAAAARDLHGMYKGSLTGIKVDHHGVSPRIITATVVGTRGSSVVSGSALESALGTYSTWMNFKTVSSKGTVSSGSGSATSVAGASPTPAQTTPTPAASASGGGGI